MNFQTEDECSGSQWAMAQFNRFLAEDNLETKGQLEAKIFGYNRDNVSAIRRLEGWLSAKFME